MTEESYKEREWLYREYVEKGRSTNDIAEDFDISHAEICRYLHRNDIRTGERDRYKYICPDCNLPFKMPSQHFERSDCDRPEINEIQRELLKGLAMGDGCINIHSKNWSLVWGSINKEFMEWFNWRVGDIGVEVREVEEYLEDKRKRLPSGWNSENMNLHKIYRWSTITHPEMNNIFSRWITDREKKFPKNLDLNPIKTCIWYCGDGGLNWSNKCSASASIATVNESDNINNIHGAFKRIGFHPSIDQRVGNNSGGEHIYSNIRFSVDETKRLLGYMGGPPPGMEYKWEIDSFDKYKKLMKNSKTPMEKKNKESIFDY